MTQNVDYQGWCQYLYAHMTINSDYRATTDRTEYHFLKDQCLEQSRCSESVDTIITFSPTLGARLVQ